MISEVMDIRGLSDYLKLAPVTLYKMIKENRIPYRRIGKSLRFPKTMIDQWLLQGEKRSPKMPAEVEKAVSEFADRVREKLQDQVKKILLYGSWARNEARIDSDIDIAVIVDHKNISLIRAIRRIAAEISLEHGKLLSVVIITTEDQGRGSQEGYPFHKNIDEEGILL